MSSYLSINVITRFFHGVSLLVISVFAVAAIGYTVATAFGFAPWLEFSARFGSQAFENAGQITQIALTILLASFLFYLPTVQRVHRLESSHRNFHIRMEDVAKAYQISHSADRAGLFTLSSEFDAVRERLAYLRDHPDLERLEPGVLDVAAQMSQQSRHLADIYSDEKIARAKDFLTQRQEEVERQQEAIINALHVCSEIRKWAQQVEMEESVVASQLSQLDEQLQLALPLLGYAVNKDEPQTNVIALAKKPAE